MTAASALVLAMAGCARAPRLEAPEVPASPPARPGVYADLNPRWSHDGQRIAFLRATPDRCLQLYVADADLQRPLALLEPEELCPDRPYSSSLRRYASPDTLAWSPDDRQIAFARIEWFFFGDGEKLPGTGLWAFDTQSGRVTPLALHPERYLNAFYYYHTPQWSPDGRSLAFIGEGTNGQRVLMVRPLQAQQAKEVVPRFDNYEDSDWPAWQPLTPADRAMRRPPALAYRQGVQRAPTLLPTETIRRIRPGSSEDAQTGTLWRMTAKRYAALLSPRKAGDETIVPRTGHLVWSPDGEWLAFTLTPDANDYARYELWVVRQDGTGAHRASPADGRGYFAPVWIGNDRLGALSPLGSRYEVVVVNLPTRTARTLGRIDSADCDWSPDRSHIVFAGPPTSPPEGRNVPTTLRLFATGLRTAPTRAVARR
ncbi:MAG TPA: hypothetical protein VFB21_08830 [Chthonomonadaceae bacterium]|nr:hypothetical protein [Chthonomonadaceae bacterium]